MIDSYKTIMFTRAYKKPILHIVQYRAMKNGVVFFWVPSTIAVFHFSSSGHLFFLDTESNA